MFDIQHAKKNWVKKSQFNWIVYFCLICQHSHEDSIALFIHRMRVTRFVLLIALDMNCVKSFKRIFLYFFILKLWVLRIIFWKPSKENIDYRVYIPKMTTPEPILTEISFRITFVDFISVSVLMLLDKLAFSAPKIKKRILQIFVKRIFFYFI